MKLFDRIKKIFIKSKAKETEAFWKFFYDCISDLVIKTGLQKVNPVPDFNIQSLRLRTQKPQIKASLPDEFSLHTNGFISPPKLQGFCNVCAAFSVTGAIEAQAEILFEKPKDRPWHRFSEQYLLFKSIDKSGVYGDLDTEVSQKLINGWWITEALNFCKTEGFVNEENFPYNPYNRNNIQELLNKSPATAGRIKGWDTYSRRFNGDCALKKHLSEYRGALIFSFQIRPDFYAYRKGIYRFLPSYLLPPDSPYANFGHAALCVGYSDKKKAWHCKNSWNEHWGENGFFWLDYAYPFIADKAYYLYF